jgi:hypothetical protein
MVNVRTHWPWISMLLAGLLAVNPVSIGIISIELFSDEPFSLGVWGPIALIGIAVMALIVLLEWRIRMLILNRRARDTTTT